MKDPNKLRKRIIKINQNIEQRQYKIDCLDRDIHGQFKTDRAANHYRGHTAKIASLLAEREGIEKRLADILNNLSFRSRYIQRCIDNGI